MSKDVQEQALKERLKREDQALFDALKGEGAPGKRPRPEDTDKGAWGSLKTLANQDQARAARVWERVSLKDPNPPDFVTSPKARNEIRDAEAKKAGREKAPPQAPQDRPGEAVAEVLRKRYIVVDHTYYSREEGNPAVFSDRGTSLSSSREDPATIDSMITLAVAKGWSSLEVSGTQTFRRAVWLQAAEQGIAVKGFKPAEVDKARLGELLSDKLQRARSSSNQAQPEAKSAAAGDPSQATTKGSKRARQAQPAAKSVDAGDPSEAATKGSKRKRSSKAATSEAQAPATEKAASVGASKASRHLASDPAVELSPAEQQRIEELREQMVQRGLSEQRIQSMTDAARDRYAKDKTYAGRVLEHGPAPYQHQPGNEDNYYVRLDTPIGERTVWGVDLPRAMQEAGVTQGSTAVLEFQGRKAVTVDAPVRDDAGKIIDYAKKETFRNAWQVIALDRLPAENRAETLAKAKETARSEMTGVRSPKAKKEKAQPEAAATAASRSAGTQRGAHQPIAVEPRPPMRERMPQMERSR